MAKIEPIALLHSHYLQGNIYEIFCSVVDAYHKRGSVPFNKCRSSLQRLPLGSFNVQLYNIGGFGHKVAKGIYLDGYFAILGNIRTSAALTAEAHLSPAVADCAIIQQYIFTL